jgi:hypothetical protein
MRLSTAQRGSGNSTSRSSFAVQLDRLPLEAVLVVSEEVDAGSYSTTSPYVELDVDPAHAATRSR